MTSRCAGPRRFPGQQRAEEGRTEFDRVRQVEDADVPGIVLLPGLRRRLVMQEHHIHAQALRRAA
jgi:hypothetical protein